MRKVPHNAVKPPCFQSTTFFESGRIYTKQDLHAALLELIHNTFSFGIFVVAFLLGIISGGYDI